MNKCVHEYLYVAVWVGCLRLCVSARVHVCVRDLVCVHECVSGCVSFRSLSSHSLDEGSQRVKSHSGLRAGQVRLCSPKGGVGCRGRRGERVPP